MKTSWKKAICSILVVAILSSHTTVASAGLFTSVVKKAAGVAVKSGGSGASMMKKAAGVAMGSGGSGASSLMKKAAGVAMNQVVPGNNDSLTGKILSKAKDVATNSPTSLTGKVLNKAKTAALDPNSLTSKVLSKAKVAAADPNSITSKLITKVNAAGADPNSLTSKVIGRANQSLNDQNSLTNKLINRAKQSVDNPNSLTNKLVNKTKEVAKDGKDFAEMVAPEVKSRVKELAVDAKEFVELITPVAPGEEGVLADLGALQGLIEAPVPQNDDLLLPFFDVNLDQVAGAADAAQNNQDNTDQLIGQIVSAGIQAGGQILSSAIANGQPVMIPTSQMNGGYYSSSPVSYSEQSVSEPIVEEVAAPAVDLELADLRFVDNGNNQQGPRYRVSVKNLSRSDVASEITVALLASMEANSDDNVSTLGTLESLAAGESKTVDLRLPAGSQVLEFLTAAAALTDGVDANENDNIATFARDSIREVALQLSSIRIEKGVLVLSGEGFGRDAGKLTLKIGSTNLPINEAVWTATEIGFKLPKVDFTKVQAGQLQVVRADGRTAQPLALNFAR